MLKSLDTSLLMTRSLKGLDQSTLMTGMLKSLDTSLLMTGMLKSLDTSLLMTGADSTRSARGFALDGDSRGARPLSDVKPAAVFLTDREATTLQAFIVVLTTLWFFQLHLEGNRFLQFVLERADDVALALLLTAPLLQVLRQNRRR